MNRHVHPRRLPAELRLAGRTFARALACAAVAALLLSVPLAGEIAEAAQKGTAASGSKAASAGSIKKTFVKLGSAVIVSGSTVSELSAADCQAVGGRVETHDGCVKVGGNDVGLKCVVNGEHVCIDEANSN